jgi:hypothetical protein
MLQKIEILFSYTLDGNKYEEQILWHYNQKSVGNKVKMLWELKNDTLIQGDSCGANFIYRFFGFSGGGCINVTTTVSVEI